MGAVQCRASSNNLCHKRNFTFTAPRFAGKDIIDRSQFLEEVKVFMPDVSEDGCIISKWYHQKGDVIKKEARLCDVESPDFEFTMTMDDDCDAIMGDIFVEVHSKERVKGNTVVCTVFHPRDDSK
ncbi:expressed unknown protein [Seminavis robusta]|uniref:Uncharacterized protein n=1 Tax=Seminavis robusta TaxID=568900 RepID=A0A9N8H9A7_9STRA|nr:expressed unknown protein [Seminavis robusta]|eukprot:Sro248_g098380.1 n/a (125) ;mRNA; r:57633-58221